MVYLLVNWYEPRQTDKETDIHRATIFSNLRQIRVENYDSLRYSVEEKE